ncbi:HSP20-like chaperone [Gigaspora rosea]|uniref:HSP20-like chaperone n=1 Tax=Gigaspora rosea TaxID=44941 RepID=A0A397UIS2_9GLOM|nr:HSP20-like chaperone [Gigaspora rosea]CAG8458992.1 26206_t:CDS:1 [Gigaspora rosea]
MSYLFEDLVEILPLNFFAPMTIGSSLSQSSGTAIPLDISTTQTHYIIRADVPGIPLSDISVEISDMDVLTISAHRKNEVQKNGKDEDSKITERYYGKFTRSLKFPKDSIVADGIKAELANGELVIKIPKKKGGNENKIIKVVQKAKL